MSKQRIEWVWPWKDAAYRKRHLRKACFEVWEDFPAGWSMVCNRHGAQYLSLAKKMSGQITNAHCVETAIVAFNPFPPTTIAIVYPGDDK
jgi:hypothetical protein